MSVSVPPAGQDEVLTTGDILSVHQPGCTNICSHPPADLHHLPLLHAGAERGLLGRAGAEGDSRGTETRWSEVDLPAEPLHQHQL